MSLFTPNSLYNLGFKKFAVRLANKTTIYIDATPEAVAKYNAAYDLLQRQTVYPLCLVCSWVLLPGETHAWCDEQDNLCKQLGCPYMAPAVKDGYCQSCWDHNNLCACGRLWTECYGNCICSTRGCANEKTKEGLCQSCWDEYNLCPSCGLDIRDCRGECQDTYEDLSDEDDNYQDDECQGGCGETEKNCSCAEIISRRRYDATPMEERCGPWTA
jgi:hypothetical protein